MSGPDREGAEAPVKPAEGLEAVRDDREEAPGALDGPIAADPHAFRLRGEPPRVMRLSRKALASLGLTACLGIGGALVYALQPARHAPAQNLIDTDSRNRADSVNAAPRDYSQTAPKLGPAMPGDLGRPILSAQQNGQAMAVPSMGAPSAQATDPRLAEAEQVRQRAAQERDSARTSRLFLGGAVHGGGSDAAAPIAEAAVSASGKDTAPVAAPTGKRGFMQVAAGRTPVSPERVTPLVSPNVVQAGSVIPAALLTGIQSDLPGQITAQVTQNVYDSSTGRVLLIPQGSRLIGEYDSEVSAGQNRVLLAWDRLILPGGRSILLDRQPGADASGTAGLKDGVNYHWGNMLRAALVSTLLGVGTQLVTHSDSELMQALRYGTQDTVNQTGRQVVQRQINVPPTLTVRPGHVLRIIVTRDLIVEPAAIEGERQ
ncbi:MAG: TrbI/VirB10 family protein [Sphingopyxis terrae]|nr:TrbI/VirB10 family protein [Sphingopyxis terrae]